jgi:hypothetical protein
MSRKKFGFFTDSPVPDVPGTSTIQENLVIEYIVANGSTLKTHS